MFKHLLVPLDGSELSEKALPVATQLLGSEGTVTLLNVIDLPDTSLTFLYDVPIYPVRDEYQTLLNKAHKNAQTYLRHVAEALNLPPTITVNTEVCIGNSTSVIVERAHALHVDAIVMSTHGRSGINRWVFGSVTQRVLGLMPCPVLVVPGVVALSPQPTPSEAVDTVS